MSKIEFANNNKSPAMVKILLAAALMVLVISIAVTAAVYLAKQDTIKENPGADISNADTFPVEISQDPGTTYFHSVTDSKIFFYSVDSVKIASMSGVVEEDLSIKVSNPIMSTDGNYSLIADKGSKTAHVFSGSKLEKTLTFEENIIIAKINKSGYSLFITEGTVHKCSVIVMSSTGEEIFKWNSGSINVISADIADNNRDIAVTTIKTDDGMASSDVIMFNITKDKPFTNDPYEDEIFCATEFCGNYLYCIGSAKTLVYNGYGKCIGTIDYEDRELINYDMDDGLITLVFSDSSVYANGSTVCSYSAKGSPQGSFSTLSKVSFIDCKSGDIAVSNNRCVSILDSKCREKFQLSTGIDLRDFAYLGGTSSAVGITATGAEIISVKK